MGRSRSSYSSMGMAAAGTAAGTTAGMDGRMAGAIRAAGTAGAGILGTGMAAGIAAGMAAGMIGTIRAAGATRAAGAALAGLAVNRDDVVRVRREVLLDVQAKEVEQPERRRVVVVERPRDPAAVELFWHGWLLKCAIQINISVLNLCN